MQIGASAIPATYPTNGQDWFNYSTASNCLVQAVLRFEQELDIQILREAVRLSVDIEPILGCQFRVADRPDHSGKGLRTWISWIGALRGDDKLRKRESISMFSSSTKKDLKSGQD